MGKFLLRLFIGTGMLLPGVFTFSQPGFCPTNLDFEFGDFTNWNCRIGNLATDGTITWSPGNTPVGNRHTMMTSLAATDPYGNFPTICPNGSNYSVKLGNTNSPPGRQITEVSYTYTIPSNLTVFSMMIWYAVVMYDPPTGHSSVQRPRFKAKIIDVATNNAITCVDFDFISYAGLPGFLQSPINSNVLYKDWTPVSIDLSPFIGSTVRVEFSALDCTLGGHFGYAYVDVNTNCNGAIQGTTICQGDNSVTLTAPHGFQSYEWYSDNTFTNLLSTNQTLPLNPAPAVGTIVPVIVIPYPTFGCRDTLYATITVSPKPVSVAGPDVAICTFNQVQIGGPPSVGFTYQWTPSSLVNNPNISNPVAWTNPPNPQEFIVKTTDILTGCFSFDTTLVTNASADTAIRSTGNLSFCPGEPGPTLSVNSTSTSVQWYNGANPIPGANGTSYQPLVTGSYWAQLTQGGCVDSTASIAVNLSPLPLASFTVNKDTGCITNHNFLFTNTSTVANNSTLSHIWKFSDGSSQQNTNASKTFSAIGTYNVELYTSSADGCKDTAYSTVLVVPNATPNFSWDSICTNRPVLFRNLSNENGSASVSYSWNFDNGGPADPKKDPSPVTYITGGSKSVSLTTTALGCESDPVAVTKPVNVNISAPAVRYRDLTVPQGSSAFVHVRDFPGGTYSWNPRVQLSNYNSRYTEFYATGNDVLYLINITDKFNCVTTDTMLIQVLKKTGFYLPTGFTPNGDGLNDVVKPYLVGMKSLKSFSIFNRWGDRMFHTFKYGEGWDGKINGVAQNAGMYVWILEFFDLNDKLVVEKGILTLIR